MVSDINSSNYEPKSYLLRYVKMSASTKVSLLWLHLSIVLLLLHLAILIDSHATQDFRHILSVKTTYNNSFSNNEIRIRDTSYSIINKLCKPVQFNGIYRHGIRNPSKKDIDKIHAFYNRVVSAVNNTGIHITLPLPFQTESAKLLSMPGKIELQSIQRRVVKRFDSLLARAAPDELEFFSSSLSRAIGSRDAFSSTFHQFKHRAPISQTVRDDLIRYYHTCQKYMLPHRKSGKEAKYQFEQFWSKSKSEKVASSIRKGLGIEKMEVTAGKHIPRARLTNYLPMAKNI